MISKETMQHFCAEHDELRPIMNIIFPTEGYYVASDGKSVLMVREESCKFELDYDKEKHGKPLNVLSVVDPSKLHATHTLKLSEIKEWIERNATEDEFEDVEVPTEFKECDCEGCCDGTITITETIIWNGKWIDLETEAKCPVCHGYGKIPIDPEYDPDECFDCSDVKNWVTYKSKTTGRKTFADKIGALIVNKTIFPKMLYKLVFLMEHLNVETAQFCFHKQMIVFLFGDITFAFTTSVGHDRYIEEGVPTYKM